MKWIIIAIAILCLAIGTVHAGYQYSAVYNVSNQTDGHIGNATAEQEFTALRNAPDGALLSTAVYGFVRVTSDTTKWASIYRSFFIFGGTADMPDNATNISATLRPFKYFRYTDLDNVEIAPVKFRYDGELSNDDYAKFDFINQSPYINTSDMTTNKFYDFVLTNTSTINVTGPSAFGVLTKYDIEDSAPTHIAGKTSGINFRTAENMTPIENATLSVTYDLPGLTTAYPMRFINDTRILPNSNTGRPPVGLNLTINSTPGEITEGGIVISTRIKDTFDMSANATTLTNATGGTLDTGCLNVTVVGVWWQSGNNQSFSSLILSSLGTNWVLTPELKLHNKSLIRTDLTAQTNEIWVENHSANPFSGYVHIDNTSIGQWMPDYQIFDNASSNGMPIPFTLLSDTNQEIRITSKVPAGTPAGNYTGLLWFNSSNTTPHGVNLTVRVLPFTLPNNSIMHSVFNAPSLDPSLVVANSYYPDRYVVTQANYTTTMRNLKEHGMLHTQLQTGGGGWDATTETMMDIRDAMDFPKDAVFMRGYEFVADTIAANITNAAMANHVAEVQTAYAAINGTHGVVDVYFFGMDEGTQEQYIYARPAYENITANDGKVYATANLNLTHLGSLLGTDVSVKVGAYPWLPSVDGMWLNLSQRNYTHERGLKAFSYSNPTIGIEYPETYRKHYGYGLQKWGFDGAMPYQLWRHQEKVPAGAKYNTTWNEYHNNTGTLSIGIKPGGFVYPKFDGYVDTLSYEGYREGTNDQRYADTLTALKGGNNRTALDTISAGIANGQDMQEIRYNMTNLILAELAAPAPTAAFSGTPVSGTEPLTVTFTDASTDTPTSWLWEYQNATSGGYLSFPTNSTVQSPITTFPAGVYDIRLTATNAHGSDDETTASYVTVTVVPPTSEYSGTPLTGTAPATVIFTDASTSALTSWKWAYKNATQDWTVFPTNSTEQNPVTTFTAGVYDINLTATNAGGSDDEIKISYLAFYPPAPVAAFSGNDTALCLGDYVQFTDASTNLPDGWLYQFGDGNTSTSQNPVFQYNVAGTFDVNLKANNTGGFDWENKSGYISAVDCSIPDAEFSGTPTSGYAPLTVVFTDASTKSPSSWSWAYNNGSGWLTFMTNDTQQNPVITFPPGTYSINLTATNAFGSNDELKVDYVTVTAPIPVAAFSVNDTTICDGDTVAFTDASTKSPSSWAWTFGDGNSSALQNPTFTYNVPGTFTVALIATNAYGSDTETKVGYMTVTDCHAPLADFTVNDTALCAGDYAKFTDTSQHVPTSWIWTFGDGNTSILQSPTFQYNVVGSQTVSLHATNAYGFDMETKTGLITVSSCAAPIASFSSSITNACTGDWVTFTDTSSGTPTSWKWVFDTTGSSTVQNPAYQFMTTGDKFVNLSATNAFGTDWENRTAYMHLSDCSGIPVSGGSLKNISAGMTVTCKGPYPHLVSLGIENFLPASQAAIYYNWISVLIIMAVGVMASSRTTRFFAILVPIVAALLMYFGWFTYNDPSNPGRLMGVLIIGIILAVAIYMKGALHERFGIAGPGSLFFNIVFYIILLQATVGFVNSTGLWGINSAITPTNEFSNIDIRAEVTNTSQAGGALGDIAGMGSIILEMTLGIIKMFISMGLALAAFGVVIGAIYPWIPSNSMGMGLLVLMQLGIYIIYYMAFMRFIYKPSGEGDF